MDTGIFIFCIVAIPAAAWFTLLFLAWIAELCKGKPGDVVLVRMDTHFPAPMEKK